MKEKSLESGSDDNVCRGAAVCGVLTPHRAGEARRPQQKRAVCQNYPSNMESKKWHFEKNKSLQDSAAAPEGF